MKSALDEGSNEMFDEKNVNMFNIVDVCHILLNNDNKEKAWEILVKIKNKVKKKSRFILLYTMVPLVLCFFFSCLVKYENGLLIRGLFVVFSVIHLIIFFMIELYYSNIVLKQVAKVYRRLKV